MPKWLLKENAWEPIKKWQFSAVFFIEWLIGPKKYIPQNLGFLRPREPWKPQNEEEGEEEQKTDFLQMGCNFVGE